MAAHDRIRLTGLLTEEPRTGLFLCLVFTAIAIPAVAGMDRAAGARFLRGLPR